MHVAISVSLTVVALQRIERRNVMEESCSKLKNFEVFANLWHFYVAKCFKMSHKRLSLHRINN